MSTHHRAHVTAEFTTEPFETEGAPPAHALAARDAASTADLEPDFGPLGTTVSGEQDHVLAGLHNVLHAALDNGATRVTVQLSVHDPAADDEPEPPR